MTTYAVFGPREVRGELFEDEAKVHAALASIPDLTALVLGGGKGVETFAQNWAEKNKIPFKLIAPNIKMFGTRKAFELRNTEMIDVSEKVVVFWDGAARSTLELLSRIIFLRKHAEVVPV